MVPNVSRRHVLAVCGGVASSLSIGSALSTNSSPTITQPAESGEWLMEQHDSAGTGYAKTASGPRNGVSVRWKQPLDTDLGFAYQATPIVADGYVYGVGRELLCVDAESGAVVFRTDR
ncbi:hypothetical protein [Haladaptatus sp. NG-SE-30]